MYKGIDVSSIQGVINWQSVVDAGYSFCIMRCGVGNSGIDSNCVKNIAGAKAVGLKVAVYHFIFPLPANPSQPLRDPVKQSQYHFNAAQGELACIDCEWPTPQDFSKWNCSPAQINQWMMAYFQEYTRLGNGRKPLLYTYPYWCEAINLDPSFIQYPLWIASYQSTPAVPKPFTDWTLWQASGGTEKLPNGVPVDIDYAKDLSLWNTVPVTQQPPEPVQTTVVPDTQPVEQTPAQPQPSPVAEIPAPPAPLTPGQPTSNIFTSIFSFISKFFK